MAENSRKLLLADDSVTIQKIIRLALSSEGYEIRAVSNAEEAKEQLAVFQPDVVIVDAALPNQAAREIKLDYDNHNKIKDIRFILLSSAFEHEDEGKLSNVEFDEKLTKPFDPSHLRKVLKSMMPPRTDSAPVQESPTKPSTSDEFEVSDSNHQTGDEASTPVSPNLTGSFSDDLWEPENNSSQNEDQIESFTHEGGDEPELDQFEWDIQEPSQLHSQLQQPSDDHEEDAFDSDQLNIDLNQLDPEHSEKESNVKVSLSSQTDDVIPITTQQMEDIIRKQLESTLKELAQKELPNIAEKIIKEEISRLLSSDS